MSTQDERSGTALDRIRLTGIAATGYHGVFEHERREGQRFVADVVVHLDTRRAAARDDLAHTLDYGTLATEVAAVLSGEPADLIETVAERIAATALAHAVVQGVDVAVHKPQAPITVPFDDVVVEIHRDRAKLPAAEPHAVAAAPERAPRPAPARTAAMPVLGAEAPLEAAAPPAARAVPVPVPVGPIEAPLWAPIPGLSADGGPAAPGPEPVAAAAIVPAAPVVVPQLVPEDAPPAPAVGRELAVEIAEGELVLDALDEAPDGPVDVVLALGANLGPAQETLRHAVRDLAATPGLEVLRVSPLARTSPVGGPDQPDFLNAVVLARTTLAPRELLRATQTIEARHGRERHEHWGPRTLDVDIVVYGGVLAVTDDLELPHPRAHERAFVLQPWAEVDPQAVLPGLGGGPVAALAATAPDRGGLRWLALDWLDSAAPEHPAPGR